MATSLEPSAERASETDPALAPQLEVPFRPKRSEEGGTQGAPDMESAFGPVQTARSELSPSLATRADVDSSEDQCGFAEMRQQEFRTSTDDPARAFHSVRKIHRGRAGQMVPARARKSEVRVRVWPAQRRARRKGRSARVSRPHFRENFDHTGHEIRIRGVDVMPAAAQHPDPAQPA